MNTHPHNARPAAAPASDRPLVLAMLTTSDYDNDPRLQKEALSASMAGHDVTVVCRSYRGPQMPYRVITFGLERPKVRVLKYVERARTNVALAREAIRLRPDVIHTANLDTLAAAWTASELTGARLLYDAYELWSGASANLSPLARRAALIVEAFVARRADSVVTVNEVLAARMAELLDIPQPIPVYNTPRFVACRGALPGAWREQFAGKRVVLQQGRYEPTRALREAVLAGKHLPDDVVLVFRGYGSLEEELRRTVREEKLDEKVFFVPPVPMNDLVVSAVGADLGLVTYFAANENNTFTSPNKLFEYIMAGVPCVASDFSFLRKVIDGYRIGALFRPGDPESLAETIMRLLGDPNELAAMRERCFRHARELSWENDAEKLLAEYRRMGALGRRGSRGGR